MQFVKQRVSLPINNVEKKVFSNDKPHYRHSVLLPNTIRCIICGPSNCGKTNVIISLIENPNGLRFENVYIYSKSLHQPKYVYLKQLLGKIPKIGCYLFSTNESVISLDEVKPNSIFIFDDVICGKQNNIRSYFCMGRHKEIDCFYLSQSYSHIQKHLIRDNANVLVLFKQDDMNLKHIFNDFGLSSDMPFQMFKSLCENCWKEQYGFVVIDSERDKNNGKYRKGFDSFVSFKE